MQAFVASTPIAAPRARRLVTHAITVSRSRHSPFAFPVVMHLRPPSRHRFEVAAREAKDAWRRAGFAERVGLVTVAAGAATVAGAALMAVAHASAALALFALPLLLAPALIAFAAAFGAVVLAAGAGAAGGALLLAPALAVGAVVRLVAELALFIAIGGAVLTAVGKAFDHSRPRRGPYEFDRDVGGRVGGMPRANRNDDSSSSSSSRGSGGSAFSWGDDLLRSFDRTLHERQTGFGRRRPRRFSDLHRWTVDDVVDELVSAGLGQFAELFDHERVDGSALLALREDDLRAELAGRAPLGARVKLWRWVEDMQRRHADAL